MSWKKAKLLAKNILAARKLLNNNPLLINLLNMDFYIWSWYANMRSI